MIWLLLLPVVALLCYINSNKKKNIANFVGIPVTAFLVGVVIACVIGGFLPKKIIHEQTSPIMVRVNETLSVSNGMIHFCYETEIEGVYKIQSVSISDATIHEENRRDAVVQKSRKSFERPIYKWLGITITTETEYYDFFIPRGSLKFDCFDF